MAFGFSPKNIQKFTLEDFEKENFLVLAIETASKLDWDVSFISETGFIAYTKYSMSSWSEEVTLKLEENNLTIKSECMGSQLFDFGKNKKNIEKFLSTFEEVRKTISPEEMEAKLEEIKTAFVSEEEDILKKPALTAKGKITNFFSLFIPAEGYYITPILLNINILIFLIMIFTGVNFFLPDTESLLHWGANFKPLTLDGQWWRLFTACFLHIGIFHLLMNMYALLYIGLLLEPYLGKTRFLAAYIITGIASSLASLWWNDITISAGASGAIFGMYGVFLALLTTKLLDQSVKKALIASIAIFVGYNILNGLKTNSGIDNAAHIGGLISGIIIGYAFIPSLKDFNNIRLKLSTITTLTVILSVFLFVGYKNISNDLSIYDKQMKRFIAMEAMALEVYHLPETTPKEKLLSEIKDRGIYYWNQNLELVENLNNLKLPQLFIYRNKKLKEYCVLRLASYELMYKAVKEDTNFYDAQIQIYNQQIEQIIKDMSKNNQSN
jgi:rhomboid protease GluP